MPASALSVSWVASASVRADLAEVSAGGVDLSAGVEAVSSPPLRDLSAPSSHVEGDPAAGVVALGRDEPEPAVVLLVVEGDRVEPAVGDATLFDELDRGPVGRKRVAPGGEDNGARRQVAGTGAAGRTGSWRAEGCVRCSMIARRGQGSDIAAMPSICV
jgi:hypothetical protein